MHHFMALHFAKFALMFSYLLIAITLLLGSQAPFSQEEYPQEEYPVSWHIFTQKTGVRDFTIKFEAYIDKGWVIYGMESSSDGPVATSFNFNENSQFLLLGSTIEDTKPEMKFEPLFDTEVLKFSQKAVFSQKVSKLGKSNVINGRIQYMACDGTKCLPPTDVPFVALLK